MKNSNKNLTVTKNPTSANRSMNKTVTASKNPTNPNKRMNSFPKVVGRK